MQAFPNLILRVAVVAALLVLPPDSQGARRERQRDPEARAAVAVDPAAATILGPAVPQWTLEALTRELRVALPGGGDASLFPSLVASTGGAPRYEATDLPLVLRTANYGEIRFQGAHVVLEPAADGKACRFSLAGVPFGGASTFEASGTVTWNAGPLGGHQVDGQLRVGGIPIEALRALMPKRIDPSVSGPVSLTMRGNGVVGEVTDESAPATPLRGDLELTAGWTVVGRTAPVTVASTYALDDRTIRLTRGHLRWMDLELGLSGWIEHLAIGKFDLSAPFENIDTAAVARAWNVPAAWIPASTLSGAFRWKGVPGESYLRYEASAPAIDLPALGGWSVHLDAAKLSGGILEVNTDVSATLSYRSLRIGDLQLPLIPGGVQWWRGQFSVVTAKTPLWKGSHTGSLSYKPAEHPAWVLAGVLTRAEAPSMVAVLVPQLGLNVDGKASMSYAFGTEASGSPRWDVHGSLVDGSLANINLPARALDALAAAEASLALTDAASLVPKPKRGDGMAVDRLFFQVSRSGDDAYDLGGLELDSGAFGFGGDGRWSRAAGLALDGAVEVPADVVARLEAAAPWIAGLRSPGGQLVVPVTLRGPVAAPVLALADGYAATLARARRGETVTPAPPYQSRRVGGDDLPGIPGDPALPSYE